jgi:hypothetical protein
VAPHSPKSANSGFDNDKKMTRTRTTDTQHVVYEDGTYIAVDHGYDTTTRYWEEDSGVLDPQGSCHRTIFQRFQDLRNKLIECRKNDSVSPLELKKRHGSRRDWVEIVERDYPVMGEVLQMDDSALYMALQSCGVALTHSTTITRQKSCWIWTLLALTGDFGTLDHERISKIRGLGLGAVQLGRRLRADLMTSQHNDAQGSGMPGLETRDDLIPDRKAEACNRANKNVQDDEPGIEVTQSSKTVITELNDVACSSVKGQDSGDAAEEELSRSDADMVMSESEDEVDGDLEQARARLLAQLGDRLVQPGMSSQDEPPTQSFFPLSRVEAERQRQEIRKEGPSKELDPRAAPTASVQKEAIGRTKHNVPLIESDWNTRAAIDMILTVVAECYGQRDLLEFREAW